MKTGIELIAEERQRQINVKGYNRDHDLCHDVEEFLGAAVSYAIPHTGRPIRDVTDDLDCQPPYAVIIDYPSEDGSIHKMRLLPPPMWPWDWQYWHPTPSDRIRELAKAGALIAAAIDRLQAQK